MNDHDHDSAASLRKFLSELWDGKISAAEFTQLCDLLRDDPAARDEYRRLMAVHAMLQYDLGGGCDYSSTPVSEESKSRLLDSLASGGSDACTSCAAQAPTRSVHVHDAPARTPRPLTSRLSLAGMGAGLLAAGILIGVLGAMHWGTHDARTPSETIARDDSVRRGAQLFERADRPPVYFVVYRKEGADEAATLDDVPSAIDGDLTGEELEGLLGHLKRRGIEPKTFDKNQPRVVQPANDGSLQLTAAAAQVYGSTLVYEPKYGNLGYWESSDDWAVWEFTTTTPGEFSIVMDYACADETADNKYLMTIDDREFSGRVEGTGSWDNYQKARMGRIHLEQGTHRLLFRAEGQPDAYLIDLRKIELHKVIDREVHL